MREKTKNFLKGVAISLAIIALAFSVAKQQEEKKIEGKVIHKKREV